jgi:hypothetical protein
VLTLLSAVVVAVAIVWAALLIAREIKASREQAARRQLLDVAALLGPAIPAAADDPRALLAWQPLASAMRSAFPDTLAALDRVAGAAFPFSKEKIEAAHARWTADWLAWELAHDVEYKVKAAAAEAEVAASGGSLLARARLDGVEREKLARYQQRYEEYVRIAKALQGLLH